jgi:FkbM family methyltransferase
MRLFNEAIGKADAIGGSMYADAIKTEFDFSSRRGIAWVVNTMRKLLMLSADNPTWAKQTPVFHLVIHYDLLLSGALRRILTGRETVGLISCHPELPDALKRTFGIDNVEFLKVPGEQIHVDTLGANAVAGQHWPERYNQICDLLDRSADRHGQLWLVASGLLGKIYAAKLKLSGAVVLDIGAVADLWMGKMTRVFPNLPEDARLKSTQDIFTLVDVGGLGGLEDEWLPHIKGIRAVLFEPNPPEAAMARAKIAKSPGGLVIEKALSNRVERRRLHVTKSLGCTSLYKPDEAVLTAYSIAPAFRITHEIDVDCVRFDSLFTNGEAPQPDAVKIDVQGFEYNVLEGFGGVLQECLGVKVEAHLYPIYKGQKLLSDIIELLERAGMTLRRIKPVDHFDGDIVEVDAWFTCSPERAANLSRDKASKLAFLEKVWELGPRKPSFGPRQFED